MSQNDQSTVNDVPDHIQIVANEKWCVNSRLRRVGDLREGQEGMYSWRECGQQATLCI